MWRWKEWEEVEEDANLDFSYRAGMPRKRAAAATQSSLFTHSNNRLSVVAEAHSLFSGSVSLWLYCLLFSFLFYLILILGRVGIEWLVVGRHDTHDTHDIQHHRQNDLMGGFSSQQQTDRMMLRGTNRLNHSKKRLLMPVDAVVPTQVSAEPFQAIDPVAVAVAVGTCSQCKHPPPQGARDPFSHQKS